MFDWTLPARAERFLFERLDLRLDRVGALVGVESCQLDWSIYNAIRGSGDLNVRTSRPLIWAQTVVRPWVLVANRTGQVVIPLMTALCKVPDEDWTPAGVRVSVQLHDMTRALDEWLLDDAYSLPEGTNITSAIAAIFTALGIARVNITHGSASLASPKTWLPGSSETVSWLRVINDLCELAGYFAVWADAMGVYQVAPYVRPSDRAAAWRLADDGKSNRYRELRTSDGRPIPYNTWIAWTKGTDEVDPVPYTAVNDDPTHPYSTLSLGRTVSAPPKYDVEGDAAAVVARDKAEGMADQRTFTVGARFLPVVEHEVVELVNARAEVNALASVSGRSLRCTPGATLDLSLRKVA